jgi:hypothetical protein
MGGDEWIIKTAAYLDKSLTTPINDPRRRRVTSNASWFPRLKNTGLGPRSIRNDTI